MTNETRTESVNDASKEAPSGSRKTRGRPSGAVVVSLAWLAVGLPLLWGVVQTLRRSLALFG